MAERASAASQLRRVLHILPRAQGDGVTYDDLARELEVTPERVRRDLEEVYARADYLRAGLGDDVQIFMETDRVSVWTKGQFRRPQALSPAEAAALGLGLRALAAQTSPGRRPRLLTLARTLERDLATGPAGALEAAFAHDAEVTDPAEVRPVLYDCATGRRPCRIRYLKPGSAEATDRVIEPYLVAHARGAWYVLARCRVRQAVLSFRVDRVLTAAPVDGAFHVPADFDPTDHLTDGRIYRAGEDVEVTVRYSARVARWFVERGEGAAQDDGSVVVTHAVADPEWLVSQVLQYGPDAVVVGPAWARERVVEAVTGHAG